MTTLDGVAVINSNQLHASRSEAKEGNQQNESTVHDRYKTWYVIFFLIFSLEITRIYIMIARARYSAKFTTRKTLAIQHSL